MKCLGISWNKINGIKAGFTSFHRLHPLHWNYKLFPTEQVFAHPTYFPCPHQVGRGAAVCQSLPPPQPKVGPQPVLFPRPLDAKCTSGVITPPPAFSSCLAQISPFWKKRKPLWKENMKLLFLILLSFFNAAANQQRSLKKHFVKWGRTMNISHLISFTYFIFALSSLLFKPATSTPRVADMSAVRRILRPRHHVRVPRRRYGEGPAAGEGRPDSCLSRTDRARTCPEIHRLVFFCIFLWLFLKMRFIFERKKSFPLVL